MDGGRMKHSSVIGIKLALFIGIALLFVWALIAYASMHRRGDGHAPSNESFWGDRKRVEKTFILKSGGSFELTTDIGEVTVEGWEKEEVFFRAEISGEPRFVQDFELTFDTTSQRIVVHGKNEHHGWIFDNWNDADAHFNIKVPKQCSVDVKTSGGSVTLASLEGEVRGSTSGGSVNVSDVKGMTAVHTSGGSIKGKNVEGSCEVKTSGGNIHLENIKGSTIAKTSGGNLNLSEIDGKIDAHTSGGGIFARLSGPNEGISLRTSGGSITLEVPPSIAADIDAATSGGSVECDLPVSVRGKMDDDELNGKINGGGNIIRLRTSGGSIHVRTLQ
jgi:DUF4097 and DUF4098 domain-containing protein YvlB